MLTKTMTTACLVLCAQAANATPYSIDVATGGEGTYKLFSNVVEQQGQFADTFDFRLASPAEGFIYVLPNEGLGVTELNLLGIGDMTLSLRNHQTGQSWSGVVADTLSGEHATQTADLLALRWLGFDANAAQLISDTLPQGDYTAKLEGSVTGWMGGTYLAEFKLQSIGVTAVPEPETYALMGLGLVGISLVSRRRQRG